MCLLWELGYFCGVLSPGLLPPPHLFLAHVVDPSTFVKGLIMESDPNPWTHLLKAVLWSSARVTVGLWVAFVAAFIIGLGIHSSERLRFLASPVVHLLAPVSPVAWIPFALLLFSPRGSDFLIDWGDDLRAAFLVFLGVVFLQIIGVVKALDSIEKDLMLHARGLGARRFFLVRHVLIPASLPGMAASIRSNAFAGWMILLAAESSGIAMGSFGLGNLIFQERSGGNMESTLALIVIIGIVGFLYDRGLLTCQRWLLKWQTGIVARGE